MSSAATAKTDIGIRLKENNFDGLRLVFAGMVVLFHIGILTQSAALSWMRQLISSTFAVQAFFFISGFLVFKSCEASSSLRSYFRKRFLRIAPAYITVVVAAAFLLVFMSNLSATEYFSSPGWRRYLFYNLMLANFSAPTLPGVFLTNPEATVNGSLWTIKIEVMFYCTVPILVWLIRRYGYRQVLSAAFALSLLWKCGFYLADISTGKEIFEKLSKQLPGQLSFFVGGAYAYYRTRDALAPPATWAALLGALGYALSDGLLYQAVAPICVTTVVYWMAIRVRRVWSAEKYGDFSYGLYLFHFPFVQALVALGTLYYFPAYVFAIGAVATAGAVAIFSWFFVERRYLTR